MLFGDILYHFYTLMNINFNPVGYQSDPVAELIQASGYPVAKHQIITDDGYILKVHRIPQQNHYHKPVLLVHALSASGGQWVVNGNKSLAFMLSNSGYDVWILHVRGTSYSLKHKYLSSNNPRFWDFSWHEIGVYDVSCTIDHILRVTGSDKIHYVGHSQGPTVLFALLSMKPEYNDKLATAFLLQPAALVHSAYPMFKDVIQNIVQISIERNFKKVQLQNTVSTFLAKNLCSEKPFSVLCTDLGLIFLGGDTGQIVDKHKAIHLLLRYVYDNVSIKQLIHYGQVHGSRRFQMYDYGPLINRNIYNGSSVPPEYDLTAVRIPSFIMYGTKDTLTTETDIKQIMKKLPNVQEVIRLPWNHGDIILGKDSDKLHSRIIKSMLKYE
uniref:Lipase n=1 Tax=Culicoides sonorensis TaxID=179676 RepID=A0A336M082_CULSO